MQMRLVSSISFVDFVLVRYIGALVGRWGG